MQKAVLDSKRINEILNNTINTIQNGREEIFDIAENARQECLKIKNELEELKQKTSAVINEVDNLEIYEKKTRTRLMTVSKNFNRYNEEDIRKAYEEANNARIELILKRQQEKDLIEKRKELELRYKNAIEVQQKAEKLVKQVGVAMEYLSGNLNEMIETIEDMNKRQFLGIKIIEAQEEERYRVARDIHDGPAQTMANVVLKAEICEKMLQIDSEKAKNELRNLKDVVRSSLNDIRKIIYDLRPMSLDDLGLIPTLQRYIFNYIEETDIDIDLQILEKQKNVETIIEIACFRIIQEALNNIRKHSKARNVLIKIEQTPSYISVVVKDDGVGFDPEDNGNDNLNINSGFGLIGMRERAELLNGKIDIRSKISEGTKITLTIPLNGKEGYDEK